MVSTAAVAEIGFLLGDPARVNMMIAMLDGRAWTATELAEAAGVTAQTTSSHLAKLVTAGLVRLDRQGRHRYHRLASSDVARLLEQMHLAGAGAVSDRPRVTGPKDLQMRELRSCYDHVAGRLAVELSDLLIGGGASESGAAELSPQGRVLLHRFGIDVGALQSGRRAVCRVCIDWSERRPHVAGAVGAAVLKRLRELDWVKLRARGRSLAITAQGERGFSELFGITTVRSR